MKSLSLVTVVGMSALLASASAFACPNLSGTFVCPADQDDPGTVNIATQKVVNGATVYTLRITDTSGSPMSSNDYIADGVTRPVPTGQGSETMPASFTCEGNVDLRMNATLNDPEAGQFTIIARWGLDAQGNMHEVSDATSAYGPQHQEQTCVRR